MPHLLFLIVFVALGIRWASTRLGVGPIVKLLLLGLAIQTISFAAVNWGLSARESGESKAWFSIFACAGLIASVILFIAFALAVYFSKPSISAAPVASLSAGFLAFMTLWTWWISHYPDHNWW